MHYVSISFNKRTFNKVNYRKYSEEEFIALVYKISDESDVPKLPPIEFYNMDMIGLCEIGKVGSQYHIYRLAFNKKLLDGKSYTKSQIVDVIKHELSHIIATLLHNDDCKHDSRWEDIAKEIGCNPSPSACLTQMDLNLIIQPIPQPSKQYFMLRCKKCGKSIREVNILIDLFHLFLMSESKLPITLGSLTTKSECCKSSYVFEARVDSMLRQLKRADELTSLQEYLSNYLVEKGTK